MDTTILHEKIGRFRKNPCIQFAKEIINNLEQWIYVVENRMSDMELDNYSQSQEILKRDEFINLLVDLLIVTGNADKLGLMKIIDSDKLNECVEFLYKNGVRNSKVNIYAVSSLLEFAKAEGKIIHTVKDLLDYAGVRR